MLSQDDSRSPDDALEESVHKKCGHQEALFEKLYCVHLLHMYCKENDPGTYCASKQLYRDGTEEADRKSVV